MTSNDPEISNQLRTFISSFKSVQLATVDPQGIPEASYAPFVRMNGNFYLYLSQLAQHTRNLLKNPHISLMLIEPETQSLDIFARKRATFKCTVERIERETPEWQAVLQQMEQELGETVAMICTLNDFHLFCCKPQKANFVKGFAQAYRLSSEQLQAVLCTETLPAGKV